MLFLDFCPYELDNHRQDRNDDDAVNDDTEIVLYDRDVAEEIPGGNQPRHPEDGPGDVERQELDRGHERNPSHKRRKGTHDGNEPGQDNGLAAMPFVKRMGLEQVLLVQKPCLPAEYARPHVPPDLIVYGIPQNRRPQQDKHTHGITEMPGSGHGPRRKQQRVARQERRHHQTGFAEHDDKQKKIQQRPIFRDKCEKMLIDMQDKRNRLFKKRKVRHEKVLSTQIQV